MRRPKRYDDFFFEIDDILSKELYGKPFKDFTDEELMKCWDFWSEINSLEAV